MERLVGERLRQSGLARRVARAAGRRQFRAEVLARRDAISATALFGFYYNEASPLGVALHDYFSLRYGQPRHLAVLALLSEIPAHEKPVLDVACGAGHLDHYLLQRPDPVGVVGCDLNFYQLWIARHWIAPAGWYVCGNAAGALPFVDGAFSAVLCSDAYHYIPGRQALLPEFSRCAPARPVILSRVGNREVMPNEGQEQSLGGYLSEFAGAGVGGVRVFTEDDLVRRYLHRRSALETPDQPADVVADAKWLSFVWNLAPGHGAGPTAASEWPHAVGRLGINPIYAVTSLPGGRVQLRFEFPTAWYAYENHGMLAYHPERVETDRAVLVALRDGRQTPAMADLVARFVVIGMPERFPPSFDGT
jgi:SAM-dependent methyltransferase